MKVISSKIRAIRKTGIDFSINNGIRDFAVSIDKDEIKFKDLINHDVALKVYVLSANCCKTIPMNILETGINEENDKEAFEMLDVLIKNHEDELKSKITD